MNISKLPIELGNKFDKLHFTRRTQIPKISIFRAKITSSVNSKK